MSKSKFVRWLRSERVRSELRSSYSIFVAQLLADGIVQLLDVYNGNLTTSALMALLVVVLRSIVKTLFIKTKLVPEVYTVGTLGGVMRENLTATRSKGIERSTKKNYS